MAYKPIESYGVIGDLHTAALVGMDGSIEVPLADMGLLTWSS